jgi:hypothetical protein
MAEEKEVPFFVKAKPESFKWLVRVPVPAAGQYVFATFTGVFKHLDEVQFKALYSPEAGKTDRQIADEVLIAVEDVTGENGQAEPSTEELRLKVLAIQRAAPAIAGTYRAAMLGVAAEKN